MLIKELTENAIDANANKIEIRLIENGVQFIEIIDDGSGIHSSNFDFLAKRGGTSKISKFEDINDSLKTFGFRGEALSSLCAVCDLSICTKCEGDTTATLLKFDQLGNIRSKEPQARERGTTVCCENLFKNIPIRLKELQQTIKQQLSQATAILQAYAVMFGKIRFLLTNDTRGKGVTVLLSSTGRETSIQDSAAKVLGRKVMESMQPFIVDDTTHNRWRIEGWMSSPQKGRKSKDVQLFYLNNRPIDPPRRIERVLNETFRQFSSRLVPACIINMKMQMKNVDINMTPDKRYILLEYEQPIVKALKERLLCILAPTVRTLQNESISHWLPNSQIDGVCKNELNERQQLKTEEGVRLTKYVEKRYETNVLEPKEEEASKQLCVYSLNLNDLDEDAVDDCREPHTEEAEGIDANSCSELTGSTAEADAAFPSLLSSTEEVEGEQTLTHRKRRVDVKASEDTSSSTKWRKSNKNTGGTNEEVEMEADVEASEMLSVMGTIVFDWLELMRTLQVMQCINFEGEVCEENAVEMITETDKTVNRAEVDEAASSLSTSTVDPLHNTSLLVDRSLFLRMKICGQFNRGFIIASTPSTTVGLPLFIIDQHAADEKARFEAYNRSSSISVQPLMRSLFVELTPSQVRVVECHRGLFLKNGFSIDIKENEGGEGRRVALTTLPSNNGKLLGKDDFLALLCYLVEHPYSDGMGMSVNTLEGGVGEEGGCSEVDKLGDTECLWKHASGVPRPPRVWSILASKACRSAIMIGQTLDIQQMDRVVKKLSELEQPWNCPHGRPTMRHLYTIQPNEKKGIHRFEFPPPLGGALHSCEA